jgi:tetratricopeptide (TPR) repeat protein
MVKPLLFAAAMGLCAAAPAFAEPATSGDFLRDAREEFATGENDRAIADYTQAIRLRLDDPDAWFGRGQALTAAGRFRDAIDDFDQATRLRPGFADAYLERGFAYGQAGDFRRGLEDLNRALAADPSRLRALMLRGEAHSRLGQIDLAIADFSSALGAQSGSAFDRVRLLLARSRSYALLGQNQAALDDRNEAVRLAPHDPEAYLARGGSLHEAGLHEQGLADRTEAIRLKPDFAEAWYARGSAYFLLGDYQKASSDLQEAVRLNAGYAEARNVLEKAQIEIAKDTFGLKNTAAISAAFVSPQTSATVLKAKEPSVSESPFLRVIAIGDVPPSSAEPSFPGSAEINSQTGSSAPAPAEAKSADTNAVVSVGPIFLDVIRQVVASLSPSPAASEANSPETVASSSNHEESGNNVIPASPPLAPAPDSRSAAAHNQRGRDLLQQGKYREAVDELTLALRAQPDFALALNARGFAYALLQAWPDAVTDLDAALRLDPRYANAYHNRAVAKRGAGDIVGSKADEAKARELLAQK